MQKIPAFPFTSKMTFDEKGWPQLDRGVTSKVLRKILKNYYTNGVFGINDSTCFQVAASTDGLATVKVKPGACLIQGATGYTEEEASLELTAGDMSFPRIDTVVARLNDNEAYRAIYLDIIIGTPATTPQPPTLTQSDSIWEIGLANLRRAANSTIITNSEIIDTRLDSSRCGYVTAINKIDTDSLMQQLNAYYDDFVTKSDQSYNEFHDWQDNKKVEIGAWQQKQVTDLNTWMENFINQWESWLLGKTTGWQEEIIDWFNNLREQLTENAAVSLQEQIGNLNNLETEDKENLVAAINDLTLSYDETIALLAGVRTVTLTLSASDGTGVEGKTVTLHNVATGEDTVLTYSGEGITFEIREGYGYQVTAEGMEKYITPEARISSSGETSEISMVYQRKVLEDYSWPEIIAIADAGNAEEYFGLSDTKEIELTTGEKLVVEIVGFNYDLLAGSTTEKANITFGTKDCLETEHAMHRTDTVRGLLRCIDMDMRSYILSDFYDLLPESLRKGIKYVRKKENVVSVSSNQAQIKTEYSNSFVWPFSSEEVYPSGNTSLLYPGIRSRAKKRKNINGYMNPEAYFLRSVKRIETIDLTSGTCVYLMSAINVTGDISSSLPTRRIGVVVGFCV